MTRHTVDTSSHGSIKKMFYSNIEIKDRSWYSYNKGLFPNIDIIPIKGSKNKKFIFAIPKHKFTIKESINKYTGLIKKQYNDPNLYPLWNLYFNNTNYEKDTLNITKYIQDSLYEYNPLIIFKNKKFNFFTNLQKIHYIRNSSNYDKYFIKFYIEFNVPKINIPKKIRNVKIIIKSKLLPKEKYLFGNCGKLNGGFVQCHDIEYIKNGGGMVTNNWGINYCSVYPLSKGSPNTLCGFATGT